MILLRFAMKYLKKMKDPRAITAVAVLLVCLQIMTLGRRLGIRGQARTWFILGVLLVGIVIIVVLTIRQQKKQKEAEAAEQSLLVEADSVVARSPRAARGANEAARRELVEAIEALKEAKTEEGRSGRSALHDLPWFLVLGAEHAGKSAMIRNSGLSLPGSRPRDRHKRWTGVGPGESCQWWFTNHSVILETNGRFAGAPDDEMHTADWDAVLEVLRKSRPHVPINGILVSVSMRDVMEQDSARLAEHARTLRQRLDYAVKKLETYLPVYLVFTKADLVHGFEGFFSDLEGNARDQILGATLSWEEIESGDPGKAFARHFGTLYRSLCKRRIPLLDGENVVERRGAIYRYPAELYAFGPRMRALVKTLFEPNPYGEKPLFRGFYLTAGQHGDAAAAGMSREAPAATDSVEVDAEATVFMDSAVDLPRAGASEPPAEEPGAVDDPRFLRELFTRVLLRDATIAHPTERAAQRKLFQRSALQVTGLAALVFVTVMLIVSFAKNRALLAETVSITEDTVVAPTSSVAPSELEETLQRLAPLRDHLARLDRMDESGPPMSMGFGLYRGTSVNQQARRIYAKRLTNVLLRPTWEALVQEMRSQNPALPAEYEAWSRMYRSYRMLVRPERAEPVVLAESLARFWWQRLFAASISESAGFRELLGGHVQFAFAHPAALTAGDPLLRDQLVDSSARVYLRNAWSQAVYYRAMIHRVNEKIPAFDLERVAGSRGLLVSDVTVDGVLAPAEVPGSFTREAWPEIAREIRESGQQLDDDWILAEVYGGRPPDITSFLLASYGDEYVTRWASFIGAVRVVPLRDTSHGIDALRELVASGSPFLRLLRHVADQLDATATDYAALDSVLAGVESSFEAAHALWRPADDGQRPIDGIVEGMHGLIALLRQHEGSGDARGKAAEHTKTVLSGDRDTPVPSAIALARTFASSITTGDFEATDAIEALLRRPAEATWRALLRETSRHLDARWSVEVRDQFRALDGRYPLSSVGADASREEFHRFFNPSGVLWGFYEAELAPYFDTGFEPHVEFGSALAVGVEMRQALEKAQELRSALFGPDGRLGFTFQVTPRQTQGVSGSSPAVQTTQLRIGATDVDYSQGRSYAHPVTWPGDAQRSGASLRAIVASGDPPKSIVTEGEWALFRLLDEAEMTARTARESEVAFTLTHERYSIRVPYVMQASTSTNPLAPGFLHFTCPRQIGPREGDANP